MVVAIARDLNFFVLDVSFLLALVDVYLSGYAPERKEKT